MGRVSHRNGVSSSPCVSLYYAAARARAAAGRSGTMTVVDTDRIEMADSSDERTLDMMFEWLEPTPRDSR